MCTKRRRSRRCNLLVNGVAMWTIFACGTKAEPGVPQDQVDAPRLVDVGVAFAPDSVEVVDAVVRVHDAHPAGGDGTVRVFRRARLEVPGASAAFTIAGVSGAMRHDILVVVDSAGAIRIVTHKWSNGDNSVVVQTECGPRQACPASQVAADPRSGAMVFSGLMLTGLDGNTGDPAASTLTGHVP